MIELTLHAVLAASQPVVALCAGRIEPVRLPNVPVMPTLTYQVISTDPDSTIDGPSGFMEKRIQVDAWGLSYADAKKLQDAVRQTLDGLAGLQSDGMLVFNVMQDTASDFYEPDSKLYRASTDYKVQYSE